MISQSLIKELKRIVGKQGVLFSPKDLLAYSYDATQHQGKPDCVIFPQNATQVSKVMLLSSRAGITVVPRGAGTCLSGGTVPKVGDVVLETSRMNRIIKIDIANRCAVVEPGVVNLDLQNALAPSGFMFPPDPASQKSCTLGGNVGENAGGPLCFRYGVTSKYVKGIEVVLADGEKVDFGSNVEDFSRYDFRGLFIGSEGILGIATKLTLEILPIPESSRTMLAVFDTLEYAGSSVADIVSAGIIPSSLEIMDKKMCGVVEQSLHAGYPVDAEGVLLIEVAGLAVGLDGQIEAISAICTKNRVRELRLAKTTSERDALWRGRKGAFGSIARLCPQYLVNDGTVPRNKLVEALKATHDIGEKYHVQIASVAHAGDGNLHPLILYNPSSVEEAASAKKAGEEILDICLACGGTISGEHGIGTEKLSGMKRMFSPSTLSLMWKVKKAFDPDNILNPGKLLPDEYREAGETVHLPPPQRPASTIIVKAMADTVGKDNVINAELLSLNSISPQTVVFTSSSSEVAEVIKLANRFNIRIAPIGGNTKTITEGIAPDADIILNLSKMKKVLDFDAGNSTVRVEAGITCQKLEEQLVKYNLLFPLESLFPEKSTIGGQIAANSFGPMCFGYGTARDLVLGLMVVTPTGEIVHLGGKTMKNVAGLDLCKLYIGSRGTLGVITEATLRLYPLPEVFRGVCVKFKTLNNAFNFVDRVLLSKLSPTSVELIDHHAWKRASKIIPVELREGELLIIIEFGGRIKEVEYQLEKVKDLVSDGESFLEEAISNHLFQGVYESLSTESKTGLFADISVPICNQRDIVHALQTIAETSNFEAGVTGHCGNGIISAYFIGIGDHETQKLAERLKQEAIKLGGRVILKVVSSKPEVSPNAFYSESETNLMRRLKNSLDPLNILNPLERVVR